MSGAAHWDAAYAARAPETLPWADPGASETLPAVLAALAPGEPVLDAGGGTSPLAAELLARGLGPVTVLDLSPTALDRARAALGDRAADVTWIAADLRHWSPDRAYALWHDRAAFHFLATNADRAAYAATLAAALRPGGRAVIATFAPDGPETCSGLPVTRYAPEELAATLDLLRPGDFAPIAAQSFLHTTPAGRAQSFQVSTFRRL
jgi:trans-aconitate methyltransferase